MATLERAKEKSANVDFRSYETQSVAKRFEPICLQLKLTHPHPTLVDKNLALLIANLIQLNENLFGQKVAGSALSRNKLTKLPMKLFHDYKAFGSVYYIILCYYQQTNVYSFHQLDVQRCLHLFQTIKDTLLAKSLLHYPTIFISPQFTPSVLNQLEEIAAIHCAAVVQNSAEASHIIVPDISLKHKMRDDIEYIRVLQIRDNYVLVHYWFYPDSYDVWVNSEEIESPPDFYNQQRPPHSGSWTVIAKWLLDLHKFNEYMNERDYEITSLLQEKQYLKPKIISPIANQFSGTKRPFVAAEASGQPLKRAPTHNELASEIVMRIHPKQFYNYNLGGPDFSISPQSRFLNISQMNGSEIKREQPISDLPIVCSWFSEGAIHSTERTFLSKMFDSKSENYMLDEKYIEVRNSIIENYKNNPTVYLSVSSCCKTSPTVDPTSIYSIHSFLEHWGLINQQVNPAIFITHINAQADALQFSDQPPSAKPLTLKPNIFKKLAQEIPCRNCGDNSANNRWHCTKESNYDLCDDCHADGKFEMEYNGTDFTHCENTINSAIDQDSEWTLEEDLKLLTGISEFSKGNVDWIKVSELFPNRTREECLLHFLRMPIQENFLEDKLTKGWSYNGHDENHHSPSSSSNSFDIDQVDPFDLPFITAANPIMSLIAFLAASVHPSLAATAATVAQRAYLQNPEATVVPHIEAEEILKSTLAEVQKKAAAIKENEEHEITKLISEAISLAVRKIDLKLNRLTEIENRIEREREEVSRQRAQMHAFSEQQQQQ